MITDRPRRRYTPTRLAWDHHHKVYLDGRLFDIWKDPLEQEAIQPGTGTSESQTARKKLQSALDQMALIRFETDGRKAY